MRRIQKYLIVPEDLERAGRASSAIKRELQALNIDRETIRRVAIATYEAEVNVVIHSYGGECDFLIEDDYLKITFIDNGPGVYDIEDAMKEGTSKAPKYAIDNGFGAGMGLPNMKKVADSFDISTCPEGTIIHLGFHLR